MFSIIVKYTIEKLVTVILLMIASLFFAIPFSYLWNWLGPIYFQFIPVLYLHIGFFEMWGLLILIGFMKLTLFPATWNSAK